MSVANLDCNQITVHSISQRPDTAHVDVDKPKLLVDSGASCHIFTDPKYFINFDRDFHANKLYLEMANGHRMNIVENRGLAIIPVIDRLN